MKKYYISGSSGFIGINLKKYFEKKGNKVVGIDRDLLFKPEELKDKLKDADVIIHCAAFGNMSYQKDEEEIFKANVIGTWNLLNATKNIDYKAFINISTSSVYGNKNREMNEKDTLDTDTFYGASKVSGEYWARAFARNYNKPIANVRPFSLYGPGEADFRLIPTICRHVINGEEMNLRENINHDWIFVEDFIEDVASIIERIDIFKGLSLNVGTGISYTNRDILEYLQKNFTRQGANVIGSSVTYEWKSAGSLTDKYFKNNKHTIQEGLKKTFDFYLMKYSNY